MGNWSRIKEKSTVVGNWSRIKEKSTVVGNWSRNVAIQRHKAEVD